VGIFRADFCQTVVFFATGYNGLQHRQDIIVSTREMYIGSTTQKLHNCLRDMRAKPKNDEVRQIINRKDITIRLIRPAICATKDELNYELRQTIAKCVADGRDVLNSVPKPETPNPLTPIVCVCGVSTSKSNMSRHLKSAKHVSHMTTNVNAIIQQIAR
jgi:hypothetical protein